MTDDNRVHDGHEGDLRRVRFYGVGDLAVGLYVDRVAEIAESFDPSKAPAGVTNIIELHNVHQYLENGLLPRHYTEEKRAVVISQAGPIRSAVARFFSTIDDTNCGSIIRDIDFEYHVDLLELLWRSNAFERCSAATMLPVLDRIGVQLGQMLACKKLVTAYDMEIRDRLLKTPQNAEHVVRVYLQRDVGAEVHLPTSFTPGDARGLLEGYVDSEDANPNYLGLIETVMSQEIGDSLVSAQW